MNAQSLPLGRHLLADFSGIDAALLSDPQRVERILLQAAQAAGATAIFGKFHHFGENAGVTGVLLLRESHISIHTWPEHGFAAIDAFMCGDARPDLAIDVARRAFAPQHMRIEDVARKALILHDDLRDDGCLSPISTTMQAIAVK
jgi:S-adenosylmethionine decarboxylase